MDDSEAPTKGTVVFKKGRGQKRPQRAKRSDDSDEDIGAVVKQQCKHTKGAIRVSSKPEGAAPSVSAVYAGSGQVRDKGDMGATRHLEEDTERHRDRRAQKEAFMNDSNHEEGKYVGQQGYKDWKQGFRRENTVPIHGPQRQSQFVRTTIRIDYQPDICKDYKETGYCAYGDACKFLHDRGDYKAGWELDREWEEQQKQKREKTQKRVLEGRDPDESTEDESDDDELPFACYTCRRNWAQCNSDPVRTECGHYFCESCALKNHAKDPHCPVCEKQGTGIFNVAEDILTKFNMTMGRTKKTATSTWGGWTDS